MQIWVDADASPNVIKDILYKAVKRTKTMMYLVANQALNVPVSPFIKTIRVASGFDMADEYIIHHMLPGDLVITADIPLAALVVDKKGIALNPRGDLYSPQNINVCLSLRNFNESLRSSGIKTAGPPKLSPREVLAFANSLDSFLTKHKKA